MQALSIINGRKYRPARPDCPECCARWLVTRVTAGCISAVDDASGGSRKVPGKGRGGNQRDGDRLSGGKSDGRPIAGCGEACRRAGRLASRPALRPDRAAAGGVSRAGGTARATACAVARAGHVAAGNYSAGKETNERSKGTLIHVPGTPYTWDAMAVALVPVAVDVRDRRACAASNCGGPLVPARCLGSLILVSDPFNPERPNREIWGRKASLNKLWVCMGSLVGINKVKVGY
jgi:hypothetical protein